MAEKKNQEEILKGMDDAAKLAHDEFTVMPEDIKKQAAAWMRRWYLKAGYRRLGRILVSFAKEVERREAN